MQTSKALVVLLLFLSAAAFSQDTRSHITGPINESQLARLSRNVHPLARAEFDQGAASADLALDRMLLLLSPSQTQKAALEQLLKDQQDKNSTNYHKWLTPTEFGQQFGASDADLAKVTSWLQSHGFGVKRVANGKNLIEFSGTASQLSQAFHTEVHKYTVGGKDHWANASDPQIPVALTPLVAGITTLHNFRKASQISRIRTKMARSVPGSFRPQFTDTSGNNALAPADFALIYGINSVYGNGITGSGASVAVVSRSNIALTDVTEFRSKFALSNNPPTVILNGPDPGILSGDEDEAVLDTSWSGAVAPGATIDLVISQSTNTTDGVDLSEEYIIDNNLADVMTESYGDCEANYTETEAQFYSALAAQAAAQGITYTVSTGDSGAEGCDDPNSELLATGPVSVNILAATPYNVAVGGTEFNENAVPGGNYWNPTTANNGSSAISYIPEGAWNESCLATSCGQDNAGIWAGGGGVSTLFTKPSWQAGVQGIPADGARDIPDISFTAAAHDPYLLCLDGSCTPVNNQIYFAGISGTSAATPSFAGVMALVVQSTGSRQGQAAATLYRLAGAETYSGCNSSDGSGSAGCIFNDITVGNNAVPGEPGYGGPGGVYQTTVGYDFPTGLGSVNVGNLISAWSGTGAPSFNSPKFRLYVDSPAPSESLAGQASFRGWALADTGTISIVDIAVDSVPAGMATYGLSRPDVCAVYSSANCPNVGWSFPFDTTLLVAGAHSLDVTITTSTGKTYTSSSSFTVANWTNSNPILAFVDSPKASGAALSGTAMAYGWAFDNSAAISQVAVSIDGVAYGLAQYGSARSDVCAAYPGKTGCPNLGWKFSIDTTQLANGVHTFAITPQGADGQHATFTSSFTVLNNSTNPISLFIDQPNAQGGALSGTVNLYGWAITTSVPISTVAVSIDSVSYGNAMYGSVRGDVCAAYPGRPNCPNVGWNLPVDTTQLVNGFHIITVTASTAGGQYSKLTQSFNVSNVTTNGPVLIGIDSPNSENAIVIGSTTFRGWAISSSATIANVAISIDGAPYGTATYGAYRPDVCAVYPGQSGCPNVGWSFPIDTTQLANGSHTISVVVTTPGHQTALSSTFTVANWATSNPMKVFVDNPGAQTGALSGSVQLRGWAIDQLAPMGKVAIAVDGVSLGNVIYGAPRPDVCQAFPGYAGCPNVGWTYSLDTMLLPDGPHTLEVTGTTAGYQSSTFTSTFQVANGSGSPILAFIDTPQPDQAITGTLQLRGWAIDQTGAQIVSVSMLVDGTLQGATTYGASRPDVCAAYPTAGGCPNVGWTYQFDSGAFANGTHTIAIRALSASGMFYTATQDVNIHNSPYE